VTFGEINAINLLKRLFKKKLIKKYYYLKNGPKSFLLYNLVKGI
jgi:hypothetical protein